MKLENMNNVARWVQNANHSLKRSISSVTAPPAFSSGSNSGGGGGTTLNKNWIHPPDILLYARVEYTVKFLGDVPVSQAKGTDVIKAAIQKLRFNLEVKRSQGFKLPRVELHVNLDGVNVVDAKSRMILHRYPLHRISFCADDKNDKRLFAFIAKQSAESDEHRCFVFLSDKLAEEITLTIGEAFDLAYRKFLENNGRDLELKKLVVVLRKRINELEHENADLKQQLAQQQRAVSQQHNNGTSVGAGAGAGAGGDPCSINSQRGDGPSLTNNNINNSMSKNWESFDASPPPLPPSSPIPPPPLNFHPPFSTASATRKTATSPAAGVASNADLMKDLSANGPEVGKRLENLQLSHLDDIFDQDFDPRAGEAPRAAPIDPLDNILFGGTTAASSKNGFTHPNKSTTNRADLGEPSAEDLEQAISMIDSRMAEMREGFKRGISFGNDDFQLSDFDTMQQTPPVAASAAQPQFM